MPDGSVEVIVADETGVLTGNMLVVPFLGGDPGVVDLRERMRSTARSAAIMIGAEGLVATWPGNIDASITNYIA